jgi:hypothetical protein
VTVRAALEGEIAPSAMRQKGHDRCTWRGGATQHEGGEGGLGGGLGDARMQVPTGSAAQALGGKCLAIASRRA